MLIYVEVVAILANVPWSRYVGRFGYRAAGTWPAIGGTGTAFLCGTACENSAECAAVNFQSASGTCEVVEPVDATITEESATGWTLFYVRGRDPMFNGVASQSNNGELTPASRAIDGNTSPDYRQGSCSTTYPLVPAPNWWRVDMNRHWTVNAVVLWNRFDCCSQRLRDLTIYVSPFLADFDNAANECGTFPGPPSPITTNPNTVNCSTSVTGRYLTIWKASQLESLTLCEVQVILA